MADQVPRPGGEKIEGFRVALLRGSQCVPDFLELGNEPHKLVVEFASSVGDLAGVAGLVFLAPEVIDNAQDVEGWRGGRSSSRRP